MALSTAHMIAHGRVQGVGFRYFVHQQARAYGLTGWVKNLPNGNVEIHAEGEKQTIQEFIVNVKEGPAFGYVSDLELEWGEPSEEYRTFDITF